MRLASLGAGKWQNTGGDKAQVRPDAAPAARPARRAESREALAHAAACCISTWARRSPTCATSPAACARRCATSSSCAKARRARSATSMSAAASASTTKARARARTARSTTASSSTRRRSCSRWPKRVEEHGFKPPRVMTESGRAMTAHHAVLVVNVSEVERAPQGAVPPPRDDEPLVLRHLREILRRDRCAPADRAVPRGAAPAERRPFAVCARPARAVPIARDSTICTTRSCTRCVRA